MAGFAAYEALGDDRYATTAELLVVDGTLRFGAACDDYVDEGFWCIFDSFQLKFVSEDLIGVLKVLYGKDIDQLIAYRDDILKTKPLPPSISNSIVDLRSALDNAEDVETIKEIKKKSEEWKERIDTYITGLIPSLQYSLEYSPYQDECTVTVKPTVTGGTFYWMNENNNLQKGEFENCISTIKFPTDLIGKIDETSITISIYEVETDGLNNQFIMASNKIQLTLTDPTMNVELLDSEWDALKHFVNEIESQGGQTGWDLSQGKSSVNKLKGLRIKRGYVTSINLSGKGLSGDLPLSSSTFSSLQELDFSYNKFEGNAGAFASRLSNLSYLNLAHNRISEVSPMISPNVSSLDISNQAIDKTIDLDFANLNMEQFMAQIPTILLYDHVNQRYNTDLSFICTTSEAESFNFNNTDQWALRLSYKNGQLTMPYVSSQNTFYGQSGDTLKVFALDKNGNWTGNFHICLFFEQGDANFDGTIDILDVQSIINYMFEEYKNRPFNFTAANLWEDETINIQDAICEVNLLLEQSPASVAARVKANMQMDNAECEATMQIINGKLVLNSTIPVAAFDIILDGVSAIEFNKDLNALGIMVSQKQSGNNTHFIGYSFTGATIPAGEFELATIDGDDCRIAAKLADINAKEIKWSQSQATAISTNSAAKLNGCEVYTLDGQKLNQQDVQQGNIYVVRSNGRSTKVMITK